MAEKKTVNTGTSQDTRTLVTVLLLVFVFPIGLILMWFWSKWKVWVKLLITALTLIPIIIFIAFFAATVFLVLNSSEYANKSYDAARLSDLSTLQTQINTALLKNPKTSLCGAEKAPCSFSSDQGWDGIANADGSGWVPLKLSLDKLPVDPVNDKDHYYYYCSDGKDWEINTVLESENYAAKMKEDGGDDENVYEIGSKLTVCKYVTD